MKNVKVIFNDHLSWITHMGLIMRIIFKVYRITQRNIYKTEKAVLIVLMEFWIHQPLRMVNKGLFFYFNRTLGNLQAPFIFGIEKKWNLSYNF